MAATDERATRLRRASAALALTLVAGPGAAADRVGGAVSYYADDNAVRVVSPRVSATVERGRATLDARAAVDFVSAASVDLVTAASPRGFEETRVETGAAAKWRASPLQTVGADASISIEPDFHTWRVGALAAREMFSRHGTLELGYGFSRSEIGRRDDAAFSRGRTTYDLLLGYSHVLGPRTALDVGSTLTLVDGFQANPYRWVRLYAPGGTLHATAVPEQAPETRWRSGTSLRLRTRLVPHLFGLAEYRLYADTWGVVAHTARLRATLGLGSEAWTLWLEARGSTQGAASFYRARYATFPSAPDLRTADKDLGPMWTALAGLHLEWSPPVTRLSALRFGVGGDLYRMRYLDYAFLTARTAVIGVFDVTTEF